MLDIKLQDVLLDDFSKTHMLNLSEWIGKDAIRFQELMDLFFCGDYKIVQRAAWLLAHCFDKYPSLIEPHLNTLISNLPNATLDAVKRNTLRILQFIEIPDELAGVLATVCFEYLASNKEAVAIKVFAMTVLGNIAKKEPDLKNELKLLIEEQLPFASAGFRSRANKILKDLGKI